MIISLPPPPLLFVVFSLEIMLVGLAGAVLTGAIGANVGKCVGARVGLADG